MKLEWEGRRLIERIDKLTDTISRKGAEMVAVDARAMCPVDKGDLRDTIQVHESKFENGGYTVSAGSKEVYYAPFVELGTPGEISRVQNPDFNPMFPRRPGNGLSPQSNLKRKKVKRTAVEAKPFMRPALEKNRRKINQMYIDSLE